MGAFCQLQKRNVLRRINDFFGKGSWSPHLKLLITQSELVLENRLFGFCERINI